MVGHPKSELVKESQKFNGVRSARHRQAGFTLLEILVIVVIVGILAAIATPSWLQFLTKREVEAAQDEIYQAIQQAQTQAIAQRSPWQFSIRERNGQVEWVIHSAAIAAENIAAWERLSPKIGLDEANTQTLGESGVHSIAFDFKGNVETQSIITIEDRADIAPKQCVLINNLLGRASKGAELPEPNRFGFECF